MLMSRNIMNIFIKRLATLSILEQVGYFYGYLEKGVYSDGTTYANTL
jgi:hypothetical protein